jgi:hypothetical protein
VVVAALAQVDRARRYYLARQAELQTFENDAPYGTP